MATLIDRTIAFDADSHVQGGTKEFIYICNHVDLLDNCTITEDGTSHEIDAITMSNGKVWYKYTLPKSANIVPGTPQKEDGYSHVLPLVLKTITQLDVENIMRMRFNKVSVIVPLIEGRALLFGKNVGMRGTAMDAKAGDTALGGTIEFTLTTPDNDPPEIEMPHLIESDLDLEALLS